MYRSSLLAATALVAGLTSVSVAACAQEARAFRIPAGPLGEALTQYAAQADRQLMVSGDLVAGLRTPGLEGRFAPDAALDRLLAGSGLVWTEPRPGVIVVGRAAAGAGSAWDAPVELEEVIVTGTLLRSSGDPASPVVALDRAELDRRGRATVAEVLTDLPQNYAGAATPLVQGVGSDRGGSNSVYATGVNLRGLGPSSTLVLVNGRRLAGTGARGEFADVSALPSSAVERVDVLLDGASALYGADAVAGVVNVIMRRSFEGQESRLRLAAAEGGAEDVLVSHLAGRSWSSGSAYLSVEHQTSNALNSFDRPYTADGDLRPFGGSDRRGLNSAPGNILAFDAASATFVSRFAIRPGADGVADTAAEFVPGAENRQSISLGADLLPAFERWSAYGRVRQSIGERLDLTADVRFSRRDYDLVGAAISGVFTVGRANPFFVSPTGAASHQIGYSFLSDLGPTRQSGSSESLGITAGARWALTDVWALDGYLAFAEERGEIGVFNRVNTRFLSEALGNIPDDPNTAYTASRDGFFNLFGGGAANGQAVLDFIGSGYSTASDRSRASSANLLLTGPLLTLPGGHLDVAVGLQARRETFDTRTTSFGTTVTPVTSIRPQRERSIAAVFAEARLPLFGPDNARPGLRRLDLSLAARFEDYDDFGTTTNPKVGVVWEPRDGIRARGSWGTSFRAASLPQIFDPPGASAAQLARADGSRALSLVLVGGNPDLEPETAETLTLGLDIGRTGGPQLGLTVFETRFTDRVARPVADNINGVLFDPALAPFVTLVRPADRPEDAALLERLFTEANFTSTFPVSTYGAIVDARWVNTGEVEVRGLDLSGRWPLAWGDHRLTLEGSGSWMLDYITRPTPASEARDLVGRVGNPVRLRARAGAVWTQGSWGAGLHLNHVDAYRDALGARIDAWRTVDAQVSWSPERGWLRDLRLALSVQNLFDADPPFYDAPSGFGFDAGQSSPLGRVVSLQLLRRW